MTASPHETGAEESAVERALRAEVLRRLDTAEIEHVALAIHQVDCPQLACTHPIEDLDKIQIDRARAAIKAERLWRDQDRPR